MDLCPVFCIADIPTTTLDLLLEHAEEYMEEFNDANSVLHASDRIVFMNNKDISNISKGSYPPVRSSPTAFVGDTLQDVTDWFNAHIAQPRYDGFMPHCFLVLDDQSIEDETCLFVCTRDAPLQSLRCHFDVVLQNATDCEFCEGMDGLMGSFMRSGVIMTKGNTKLAENGGMYIEDGEVKVNQAWRDFGSDSDGVDFDSDRDSEGL